MGYPRIAFLCHHFGEVPIVWPAFAVSCERNPEIHWYLFSDMILDQVPENVTLIRMSFPEFLQVAQERLGVEVRKTPYSACDLRPAFSKIFEPFILQYDFWGHADLDVVWGRLEMLFSVRILSRYDVVSSRRGYIAGHCTIYRNCRRVNDYYKDIPSFFELMKCPRSCHVDEIRASSVLRRKTDIRVFWFSQHVVDQIELSRRPFEWRWEHGRILDCYHVERTYLHFGTLKKTIRRVDFTFQDKPERFVITPRGIFRTKSTFLLDRLRVPPSLWLYKSVYEWLRGVITGRPRH
ncbi:MAG: hypothetical protein NZ703_09940 [Gemmataceae bacterium]|nr:hypothetical protein [Gemmataceae bacterium]